ncbi:MAG: hypothetical protein NUV82_03520 [Candidatus Komeilibacteria bacterium]|nr:hypothetical protein [Candidatus Komeilibacteria bacterium]
MSNNAIDPQEGKTISIKLPKIKLLSLQMTVLVLLILVGALQTIQLLALDRQVSAAGLRANTTTTSTGTAPATTPNNSSLPTMVGGC